MEFNAKKIDEANAVVTATLQAAAIDESLTKIAKQAAKTLDVQGFRKGKVPVAVVKSRYAEKLQQDAEGEALRALLNEALAELKIANSDLIGEPSNYNFNQNKYLSHLPSKQETKKRPCRGTRYW